MRFLVAVLLLPMLCGCTTISAARLETARVLADRAGFQEVDLVATPFILRGYVRVDAPTDERVRVFIEGDGLAWLDRTTRSPDPTPLHPVGLALAAADPGPNVIYLARPCQYINMMKTGGACPADYWTDAMLAPEVITAYNRVLDHLILRYGFRQIELVGYSGGGGLAILIAAGRQDVVNLRTVAGNLDTARFTELHDISPLSRSLNPIDAAGKISNLPQVHIVGAKDKIVPIKIFQSFYTRSEKTNCITLKVVANMKHMGDWPSLWPALQVLKPDCEKAAQSTAKSPQ